MSRWALTRAHTVDQVNDLLARGWEPIGGHNGGVLLRRRVHGEDHARWLDLNLDASEFEDVEAAPAREVGAWARVVALLRRTRP